MSRALWNTTLDADGTCDFLAGKLKAKDPFCFIRFGDADIDWMAGGTGHTCDQEHPRAGLRQELQAAWDTLCRLPHFYLGDCESFDSPATDAVMKAYRSFRQGYAIKDLHTEALLLHRESEPLAAFYRTLRADSRKKVLVAPMRVAKGGPFLRAQHVAVDETTATSHIRETIDSLERLEWEIMLTCCGRASKLLAAYFAPKYPNRTIIELGSALDPLFYGRSRGGQLSTPRARALLGDILL